MISDSGGLVVTLVLYSSAVVIVMATYSILFDSSFTSNLVDEIETILDDELERALIKDVEPYRFDFQKQ